MRAKLMGVERATYPFKEKTYTGFRLHVVTSRSDVVGVDCSNYFLNDTKANLEINYNDMVNKPCELLFNRFGKLDSIEFSES